MSLSIIQCTEASVWDCFVAGSPQGNLFCSTRFLDAVGADYELLFVNKKKNVQLGAVIVKQDDGEPTLNPFMYQGVLFDSSVGNLPTHKRVKKSLELVDFLLAELEQRYTRISFSLHHAFSDLRSFQWFHYHEPDAARLKVNLNYTGLLEIDSYHDFEHYLSSVRKVRRYEYRKGLREGLAIEVSNDLEILDRLHEATFKRQGIEREEEKRLLYRIVPTALAEDFGELLVCRNKDGKAISATFFLYDEYNGYYLFGANDFEHGNAGGGTVLMLEIIRRCFERGLKWVDFVGINSPNRGDFKTSFNAVPVPYFVVIWECSRGNAMHNRKKVTRRYEKCLQIRKCC